MFLQQWHLQETGRKFFAFACFLGLDTLKFYPLLAGSSSASPTLVKLMIKTTGCCMSLSYVVCMICIVDVLDPRKNSHAIWLVPMGIRNKRKTESFYI